MGSRSEYHVEYQCEGTTNTGARCRRRWFIAGLGEFRPHPQQWWCPQHADQATTYWDQVRTDLAEYWKDRADG